MPLTQEWFETQKKMLKQANIKEPSSEKASDDFYTPSAAAQKLPSTKQDKFLENVKPEILKMDPGDEDFVPNATMKLIDGVIRQEYGEHFTRSPGYGQMQSKIARTILEDPSHRETVEDFLSVLVTSHKGPETPPQPPQ